MRQERITKNSRRRTTRQAETAPLVLPESAVDVTEIEAILASIEQLVGGA